MGPCLSKNGSMIVRSHTHGKDDEMLMNDDVNELDSNLETALGARGSRQPWRRFLDQSYWKDLFRAIEHEHEFAVETKTYLPRFARGDFSELLLDNPKVFAVFVSSTFTDTEEERNLLVEDVQPYLREVCSLFGYDFRFCEMRWGVRDDASEDHQTADLCLQELYRCQQESCGINFITFLCDKYGYCPFPSKIPQEEFEELLSYINEETQRTLLLKWFKIDKNKKRPEYVLQKISSVICNYNSDDEEKRKQGRSEWWSEFEILQRTLKSVASKLVNKSRRKFYEISVTELEVLNGLIEVDDRERMTFVINRTIKKMEEKVDEIGAGKFIDIDWNTKRVNQESREKLLQLKNEKVPQAVKSSNIKHFEIEWSKNGIKKESHSDYLQSVTDTICLKVLDSIKEHFMQNANVSVMESNAESRLEKELKQGAVHMKNIYKDAIPRTDVIDRIQRYILNESSSSINLFQPLVITGESGSGKSTIMASLINNTMSNADSDDVNVFFRFVGTTGESGDTKSLLTSLLHQIHIVQGTKSQFDVSTDNIEILAKKFKDELNQMNKRTVIFLDALDQLSDIADITEHEWLPMVLHPNIKLVISCATTRLESTQSVCFHYLKATLNAANFISITQLNAESCQRMLSHWLEKDGAVLSSTQLEVLESAFQRCSLPLFVKIAFDGTKAWHSYTDISNHPLKSASSIEDLIIQLYKRLMIVHGNILFKKALAYLTAAKDGLSRQELEDILSCDDDVLNDIFQWWTPPIRRIPQLQVVRFLSDLKDYLIETTSFSNGVPVLRWFHMQFREATKVMIEKSLNFEEIHQFLANYFGGTWAVNGKLYKDRETNMEVYADRKIPRNNLIIQGNLIKNRSAAECNMSYVFGNDCKINIRRLNEHCYHLIKGGMLEEATAVLCSLQYIHSKVQENKLNDLRQEYALILNTLQSDKPSATREKLEEFNTFILQRGHVLNMLPSLIYQEAANYFPGSNLHEAYKNLSEKPPFILKSSTRNGDDCLVSILKGHLDSVVSVAFQRSLKSRRANILATGSLDGRVKVWFYKSCLQKSSFRAHNGAVNFIDFCDEFLLTISAEGRMILWDAENLNKVLVFTSGIVRGNCCKFANCFNNEIIMLSAWDDGCFRIGNMQGDWIYESHPREYAVTCLSMIGNDGIVAGYANGAIISYKLLKSPDEHTLDFKESQDFATDNDLVDVFAILVHDDIFVVVGKQKRIRTQYSEDSSSPWAQNTFRNDPEVQKLVKGGMELSEAIRTKMDKDLSSTGTFLLLKGKEGSCNKHMIEGLPTPHEYVCADLRFPYLVTGGSDGSVRLWILERVTSCNQLSVSLLKELGTHSLEVNSVCFDAIGPHIVSVSDDTDVKLWSTSFLSASEKNYEISQTKYKITGCNADEFGSFTVTWGKRGLVSAWRGEQLLWTKICCSGEDITSAAVAPNGHKIMVGAKNYYELMNGKTGERCDVMRSCVGRRVRIFDFSKDGTTALLGDDLLIRLVIVEPQMEPIGFNDITWKAHDNHVTCGQFCNSNYYAATGSSDGSIKMWNISKDCCLTVRIGLPILAFDYVSAVNKIACILDGDASFDVQVLVSNVQSVECSEETRNPDDVVEIRDFPLTTELQQKNHKEFPMKGDSNEEPHKSKFENCTLPMAETNCADYDDVLSPTLGDFQSHTDSVSGFDLMPELSEEMMKNLQKLQEMLMNPPDLPDFGPRNVPSIKPGPHRLLRKEKRKLHYSAKKIINPSSIAVVHIDSNDADKCKIVVKEKKPGLNSCVLSNDGTTLFSSSSNGYVYVWRILNGAWYDIARFIYEDETFLSDLAGRDNEIVVTSNYYLQKLSVISN